MHHTTYEAMLAAAKEAGAKLYAEVNQEGLFVHTVEGNQPVLRMVDTDMDFFGPTGDVIYQINEVNENKDHDVDHVNSLIDAAWGVEGIGAELKQTLDDVMDHMMGEMLFGEFANQLMND